MVLLRILEQKEFRKGHLIWFEIGFLLKIIFYQITSFFNWGLQTLGEKQFCKITKELSLSG